MANGFGDIVTARGGEVAVDHDVRLRLELMTDPADADARDRLDAGLLGGPFDGLGQRRIDCVHEPHEDLPRGTLEDPQDGHGDQQPDDRVRLGKAEPHARRADDDRQ